MILRVQAAEKPEKGNNTSLMIREQGSTPDAEVRLGMNQDTHAARPSQRGVAVPCQSQLAHL